MSSRIHDGPVQGIMVSRPRGPGFSSVTLCPGLEDIGENALAGPQAPMGQPLDRGLRQIMAVVNSGKMGISVMQLPVSL